MHKVRWRHTIHQAPPRGRLLYGEMIHMQINKVAFIGKGGVGLLYGSMIAQALGNDAVEYVMDDARFERHANDALTVNGKPCDLTSVRASEATPADLVSSWKNEVPYKLWTECIKTFHGSCTVIRTFSSRDRCRCKNGQESRSAS